MLVDTDEDMLLLDTREMNIFEEVAHKAASFHSLGAEAVAGAPVACGRGQGLLRMESCYGGNEKESTMKLGDMGGGEE